jgi:hypothetical protein
MATKRYYATGGFRYGTRMLTAGDPVDMDAPTARLYTALNKISPTNPKRAAATPPVETPPPAAPTAQAPKRKAAARKKRATAKK